MPTRPGPHIALVRLALAITLIGLTAPKAITGAAVVFAGARSVVLSERLDSFGYFGTTLQTAGRSLATYSRSWCLRYGPAIAATAFALYLFRRRTPPGLRNSLGYKP